MLESATNCPSCEPETELTEFVPPVHDPLLPGSTVPTTTAGGSKLNEPDAVTFPTVIVKV